MTTDLKVSIQFLAELEELRAAVPQIKAVFQQLLGVSKDVGDQTSSAAKAAGAVLLDQFGNPVKKVAAELKSFAQEEQKAAAGAKEVAKATKEVSSEADKAAGAAAKAGRALKAMGEDGKAGSSGAAAGLKDATAHSEGFGESLGGLARKVGLAYVGLQLFRQGLAFVKEGLDFSSKMETAQLGIASLISAQAKLTDATGQELKGRDALNAAMVLSSEQMQKLKIAGLETVATTEQLVVAFQQAVGVGLSVGMNLDQIREVTIKITQAASALGLPMNQLAEEVRDLLQGNINPRNTRIATALQITNEEVKKWKAAGGSTLADELNKRMEAFGLAGELAAKTWQGVTSNVIEATQTLAGEMTKPLFTQLRDGLQGALEGVFDLKKAKIADEFGGLVEAGQTAFAGLGSLGVDAIRGLGDGLKVASAWFRANKILVEETITNAAELVRQFFVLSGTLRDVLGILGTAEQKLNVISFIFKVLSLTVAGIGDGLRLIASAILGVGTVILNQMLKPLQAFMNTMADGLDLVGKGDWAKKLRGWSQDLQGVLDASAEKTKRMFDPLADGTGAVGSLRTAWENVNKVEDQGEVKREMSHGKAVRRIQELREEIGKLEQAQAASARTGGKNWDLAPEALSASRQLAARRKELEEVAKSAGITLQARNVPTDDKHKLQVAEWESIARAAKNTADAAERSTLAQEEEAKLLAWKAEFLEKTNQLEKARLAGLPKGRYETEKESLKALNDFKINQIGKEYNQKREALEADLQARLNAQEEGGLAKRQETIRKYFKALRTDNDKAMLDGKPFLTADQILSAEQEAMARERIKQVREDLAKIKQEMATKAQELGRGITDQEKLDIMKPHVDAGGTRAEAAGQKSKEDHLGDTGTNGILSGVDGWLAASQNAFAKWKGFATNILGGTQTAFAGFFSSILQHGMTAGEKWNALWQGLAGSVVKALSDMAAQEVIHWGLLKAKALWNAVSTGQQVTQSGIKVAANTAEGNSSIFAAAAGFFKAHSWIPFVGLGIAIAMIASMTGLLKGITGRKVGGVVGQNGPELTMLGEGGELEVVAPEHDFKDWARGLVGMGANLQANIASQQGQARSYQEQGTAYAQSASQTQRGDASGSGAPFGFTYADLRGAVIAGESSESRRIIGKLIRDVQDDDNRRNN